MWKAVIVKMKEEIKKIASHASVFRRRKKHSRWGNSPRHTVGILNKEDTTTCLLSKVERKKIFWSPGVTVKWRHGSIRQCRGLTPAHPGAGSPKSRGWNSSESVTMPLQRQSVFNWVSKFRRLSAPHACNTAFFIRLLETIGGRRNAIFPPTNRTTNLGALKGGQPNFRDLKARSKLSAAMSDNGKCRMVVFIVEAVPRRTPSECSVSQSIILKSTSTSPFSMF